MLSLLSFVTVQYEMGDYITANELLGNYIAAIGDRAQFSTVRYSNALWGRLACLFHTQQWSEIKDAVEAVRDLLQHIHASCLCLPLSSIYAVCIICLATTSTVQSIYAGSSCTPKP